MDKYAKRLPQHRKHKRENGANREPQPFPHRQIVATKDAKQKPNGTGNGLGPKFGPSMRPAFWGPGVPEPFFGILGVPFSTKIWKMVSKKASKNRCRKSNGRICEKYVKMIQTSIHKSEIFQTCPKKAERHETIIFPIENVVLALRKGTKIN